MTYLVGFSGPPRSGKDTIGGFLAAKIEDLHGVQPQQIALSEPMRHAVYGMLGIAYDQGHYERFKDRPQEALGGKTIRQAMIALSEEHVKPSYGQGYWAVASLNRLWQPRPKIIIVTDMGFDAEVAVFEREFGIENCIWPQLRRKSFDFSSDSRNYVGNTMQRCAVMNDGPIDEAVNIVYAFMLHCGWQLDAS